MWSVGIKYDLLRMRYSSAFKWIVQPLASIGRASFFISRFDHTC